MISLLKRLATGHGSFLYENLAYSLSIGSLELFAHSKFMTRDRQSYVPDKMCALCKAADKTNWHLFFECGFSKGIWDAVRKWLGMKKNMFTAATVIRAFRSTYRGNSLLAKMRCTVLAACIYLI